MFLLEIFSNSYPSVSSDIPMLEGVTSPVYGNSIRASLCTKTKNGTEWCWIQPVSYFLSKNLKGLFFKIHLKTKSGSNFVRKQLNFHIKLSKLFFFFWSWIFSLPELLCRVVLCTACSRALRNTQWHSCLLSFTGLLSDPSLIIMKSTEFCRRRNAHDTWVDCFFF